MRGNSICLVGRAHSLAFDDASGAATWTISIRRRADLNLGNDIDLKAIHSRVLEQFEQMNEGQLISVIAVIPPKRQLVPGVRLTVTRLELLSKDEEVVA